MLWNLLDWRGALPHSRPPLLLGCRKETPTVREGGC